METKEKTELTPEEQLAAAKAEAEAMKEEVANLQKASDLAKMDLEQLSKGPRAAPQFPLERVLAMHPTAFYDATKNHLAAQLEAGAAPRLVPAVVGWHQEQYVDATVRYVALKRQLAEASPGSRYGLEKQLETEAGNIAHYAGMLGIVPILKI